MDGIFEVVADIGDSVCPTDHFALGSGGGGTRPGVVADAVEGLEAQIERRQDHIGPPDGVVVAVGEIGGEGILAGVTAGTMATVVPERDGLGERLVELERPSDPDGDLGHLEGVGESCALVVVGEDEHLGLAGEPAEGRGAMEDAVAVALEAGAHGIGGLRNRSVAGSDSQRGAVAQRRSFEQFTLLACEGFAARDSGAEVSMGVARGLGGGVPVHGGGPDGGSLRELRRHGAVRASAVCASAFNGSATGGSAVGAFADLGALISHVTILPSGCDSAPGGADPGGLVGCP